MTKSFLVVAALFASVLGAPSAAQAAEPPVGAVRQEVYFPSTDGTPLHGDLLLPAQGCPDGGCPVIVSVGPYFGSGTQSGSGFACCSPTHTGVSSRFFDFITYEFAGRGNIFEQDYAWLQVDSRGYGGSGGCNDLGGRGEQEDVYAAVEWAGTQPWSNGNVGMWGKSYDGWTQVMGLAQNPPHLEAVVIQAPLIEGYGLGWDDGVHLQAGWYLTPSLYMIYDHSPNSVPETVNTPEEAVWPAHGTATSPCWAETQAFTTAGHDHDLEYWRQRDLRASAGRNDDVAVLWSHGFNDVNTKPDQIFGVYTPLTERYRAGRRDAVVRAWFGEWDHRRGNEARFTGRYGFLEEALDLFDHYLKGLPFRIEANEQSVSEIQDNEGAWRTEASYPPQDIRATTLHADPGTYRDDLEDNYWTLSEPAQHDLRLSGEPVFHVDATIQGPYANLVAVVYDVDPDGLAVEISRGAYRLEGDGDASFNLYPRDHILRPGHRLGVRIGAGHREYQPTPTWTTVTVNSASVDIPFLIYERVSNVAGSRARGQGPFTAVADGDANVGAGMVLPGPMLRPDPAVREALQPTVSTGCDAPSCAFGSS